MPHDCEKNDEWVALAHFTGKVENALEVLSSAVDRIFKLREKKLEEEKKRDNAIAKQLAKLDKSIYGMKIKFSLIGLGIGVIATPIVNLAIDKIFG